MVWKRARYENNGTFQTLFTVNFRDEENVSEIFQSYQGNRIMEGKMAEIFCKLQENLIDYDFSNSQQEEILPFVANQNENQSK